MTTGLQPAGSVPLWGKGSEKGQSPLPSFLPGRKLSPSSGLDAKHRLHPQMPLLPFALLLWGWSSEGGSLSKSVCGFFKKNCLGLQKFLPLTKAPLVFIGRSFGDLPPWHWNPGLGSLVGLGLLYPEISLLNVYPPQVDVGPDCSASSPLLLVWMDVVSLIPELTDSHSPRILMVLSAGCS